MEEKYPNEAPLLPSDIVDRARTRAAFAVIACDTQPVSNLGVMQKVNHIKAGEGKILAKETVEKGIAACEKLMSDSGPFLMGNALTMADIAVVAQLHNARRFGVDLSPFPKVMRAEAACYEKQEFLLAHPYYQPDCPEELQKKSWDWVENSFKDPRSGPTK